MTTQARELAGIISNAGDLSFGDDVTLKSDGSILNFGADSDVTLTHVADAGLLFNSTRQLQFGDAGTYIYQSADGVLNLTSDTEVEINATTIDINGNVDISGTLTVAGALDFGDLDISNVGSIALDTITNDGTDLTLDSSGDIILDADGKDIILKDGGTEFGRLKTSASPDHFYIKSAISDNDLIFQGNDGGSTIDALTFDMSAAGAATFNDKIIATELDISGNADIDGTLEADVITVDGTALNEYIADTVGAMVGSNTESGITVAYQDGDNTLDFTVGTLNQNTSGTAAIATTVTITDNESTNETNAIIFTAGGDVDGGNLGLESDGDLTYNPSSGTLASTVFSGALSGNATTATALASARTIGGVSFDGSANIAVTLAATATALASARTIGGTSFDGTANIVPGTITIADESSDTTCFPLFVTAATGDLAPKSGSNLAFNSSNGELTATTFVGALTGNASGTALTVTQAAQTAITSVGTLTGLAVSGATTLTGALTVGVDNTGLDVKLFGATTGRYALWNQANDSLDLMDSVYLRFGTSADLNIFHNGSHSYINDSGTGNLYLRTSSLQAVNASGNETMISAVEDGAVTLYYDNSAKVATVTDGATVTGLLTATTSANITQVALTSSSSAIAWDAKAKANAYHVTTENTTFSAPSNAVEGAIISVEIAQGGTARTISWNTVFEFAASTAPTITATASKTDILSFRYNGSVWQEIGRVQNMAQT